MRVAYLLSEALTISRKKYSNIYETWICASHKVGSRLPSSLLPVSIQREGQTDLVLRSLEDELLTVLKSGQPDNLLIANNLNTFSIYWIGGMYEIFRVLRIRALVDVDEQFSLIFNDLELLRMPLEKHEVTKDRQLKEPVKMLKSPPNDDGSDIYLYSPRDPARAHIMPSAISQITGSMMWHVIDIKEGRSFWIERRWLSDKILELWA